MGISLEVIPLEQTLSLPLGDLLGMLKNLTGMGH